MLGRGAQDAWRVVLAAALLLGVAAACALRDRREARVALVALPLALAVVPALPLTHAALAAGLGLVAASLSLPAQGRSLAVAGAVLGLGVAAAAGVALLLANLADATTPMLWAPLATLVLVPVVVLTTRRFLSPEATP